MELHLANSPQLSAEDNSIVETAGRDHSHAHATI
jgi:hypothetical protein